MLTHHNAHNIEAHTGMPAVEGFFVEHIEATSDNVSGNALLESIHPSGKEADEALSKLEVEKPSLARTSRRYMCACICTMAPELMEKHQKTHLTAAEILDALHLRGLFLHVRRANSCGDCCGTWGLRLIFVRIRGCRAYDLRGAIRVRQEPVTPVRGPDLGSIMSVAQQEVALHGSAEIEEPVSEPTGGNALNPDRSEHSLAPGVSADPIAAQ